MSTHAFLFYAAAEGELRGTWINGMGFRVQEQIAERFGTDYDAIVEFIESGRVAGGYRYATDEAPRDQHLVHDEEQDPQEVSYSCRLENGAEADAVWFLTPEGELKLAELTLSYSLRLLPQE